MRRGALNFAQNGNLLRSLWNEQFIPISEQHILWPADPAFHDAIHVYYKPTHGLSVAQLGEQCLANCQTLGRAGRTVPTIRGGAAGDGLERERRQIALHSVGQQIELLLFTLLQFFSNENGTLLEREIGESSDPMEDGRKCLAATNRILAGKTHFAR